ncbi:MULTISPECIES: GIY-YIG nuclease family protein [Planktothrix]|uniref:Endonuclease n=1 Tax=Planktothrix rubescens CCAP 1459/22 TaxID=329571 RepID=A0A6J7ZGA4_PLARU|nr:MULTISPECIES: GIY-YIG nuclease family protein [Planktothrix]CAC5340484.1 putative endonuclease [Planktothrix rubescens NIVA-CYA 18]CAD0224392.1 conserved hypothetical protein [Planktothrix agardhii]CAD5941390.1 hypothetical protein PCC7821_01929 [Planktothrix rubescens NIVA-CYA 18]CAD5943222.1 hypothetical protein NO758_02049 [Planktothrix agardhii]
MEWKSWSSLPLKQREQLPPQPGIYVVVDAEQEVWYVGRSININARWNGRGHHRYPQLSRTNNQRLYRIYWQLFTTEQLNEKEQLYIDLFKPHLNYSRVKTYARKPIQPNQEISRLLKVINKKTTLFPDVRSVVLGYYTEIDEDEDGSLKEYNCVVIVVSINDHDRPIINSCQKSQSRKGKSLEGYWKVYESECGSADPNLKPAFILVFMLENIVYEFVCYPTLIHKLAGNRSSLHYIQIAKQTVLALTDTSILPSIMNTDSSFRTRREDYLHYRAADLKSVLDLLPEISI